MKKYLYIFSALLIVFTAFCDAKANEVCTKFVRFHIIANSDSPYDQHMKLKLRDHILNEIKDELKNSRSKRETIDYLSKNCGNIKELADSYLALAGCDMKTKVFVTNGHFPEKNYGDFILPEGNYDSFKIIIGEGKGKNFFCVMFPPACISNEMTATVNEMLNKGKITYKFKIFSKE